MFFLIASRDHLSMIRTVWFDNYHQFHHLFMMNALISIGQTFTEDESIWDFFLSSVNEALNILKFWLMPSVRWMLIYRNEKKKKNVQKWVKSKQSKQLRNSMETNRCSACVFAFALFQMHTIDDQTHGRLFFCICCHIFQIP